MGWIKAENVRGYNIGLEIICMDCVTDADLLKELTADEVIDSLNIGEDLVFCDRCKKQIEGDN